MVVSEYFDTEQVHSNEYVGQILMRPNSSMSWRATQFFLATLITISISVAFAFMAQGFWMILPFSVLEMSILSACFYYSIKRAQIQEVIYFAADEVVIEIGRRNPDIRHRWQRFFTKVIIEKAAHPWYPDKILLRCQEQEEEIGKFLTSNERKILIQELRSMISAADSIQTKQS